MSFISTFYMYICIKIKHMILIISPEEGDMLYYPTLISACKKEKWMKYSTLKNKSLSNSHPLLYKGKWLYRIAHSLL